MAPKLRYRKISVRIWADSKFRELSQTAKLVWFFILTSPNMGGIGAMRATIPGMAAEMGITEKAFKDAFKEITEQNLARLDDKAGLLVVPNFLKHNSPENPNVVKGWMAKIDELPECNLLTFYSQQVKGLLEGLPKGFKEALLEGFGEGLPIPFTEGLPLDIGKGMPNQEQEHLPLPLQEPPLPPKGEMATVINSVLLNQVVDAWNVMAEKCGLSTILKLTDSRKTHLKERLEDPIFQKGWKEAIDTIPKRSFLLGENDRGWKASFDFFLRPDSVVKIIEGHYQNQKPTAPKEPVPLNEYTRFAANRLESIKFGLWDCDPAKNPGEVIYQDYKAKGLCE